MRTIIFNSKTTMMMYSYTMQMQMIMHRKIVLFCALYVT
jgi:hypothetical protein